MSALAAQDIEVTPKALQKIRQTFEKMGVQGGLRLGVLGGGCSGLSYQFKFDTQPRPKDKVFDFDGVQIFVDPKSILYLHGMTLDYKDVVCRVITFSSSICRLISRST
jgi:iron-sulfur cluster assembly protein